MSTLTLSLAELRERWVETQRETVPAVRGVDSRRILTLTHAEYCRLRENPNFTDLAIKDAARAHGFDSVVVSG